MKELGKARDIYLHNMIIFSLLVTLIQKLVKNQCMISVISIIQKNYQTDLPVFKNLEKPSCIDFLLRKSKSNFDGAIVLESRLSDFQKLAVPVLKSYFKKEDPRVIIYGDYKYFDNEKFSNELENKLIQIG